MESLTPGGYPVLPVKQEGGHPFGGVDRRVLLRPSHEVTITLANGH